MIFKNLPLLHASHEGHSSISNFFSEHLGVVGEFIEEVIFHGLIDTLPLIPFLFLTYLLMEFIETDDRAKEYRGLDWSLEYDLAINGDPNDTQSAL